MDRHFQVCALAAAGAIVLCGDDIQEGRLAARPAPRAEPAVSWTYNDQLPGPQIRVHLGDRVRVVLKKELPESIAIHFHGLELRCDTLNVAPGERYDVIVNCTNRDAAMARSNEAPHPFRRLLARFPNARLMPSNVGTITSMETDNDALPKRQPL
jgi:FtsP/CotA-like multicopper oxidase with cupredoxin domain